MGIGRAVCKGFAAVGASVVVADINEKDGRALVAELEKEHGGKHLFAEANVAAKACDDGMIAATFSSARRPPRGRCSRRTAAASS